MRDLGLRVGLAANPDTPFEALEPYLDQVDLVLCMTVFPGLRRAVLHRRGHAQGAPGPRRGRRRADSPTSTSRSTGASTRDTVRRGGPGGGQRVRGRLGRLRPPRPGAAAELRGRAAERDPAPARPVGSTVPSYGGRTRERRSWTGPPGRPVAAASAWPAGSDSTWAVTRTETCSSMDGEGSDVSDRSDEAFMARAMDLAAAVQGTTAPNPWVGLCGRDRPTGRRSRRGHRARPAGRTPRWRR